jgi:Trk K+ transport system NAD-binding subunit
MAKHIFRVPVVICRIEDPTKQQMYAELDLAAVSSSALVTQMIVEAANK